MVDVAGGVGGLEAVARALRESRASRFYACAIEGGKGERELKAAKTRGRWERLAQSATLLRAERIECRDDDGATLAVVSLVVEDDAPEAAAAPLADPAGGPWSGVYVSDIYHRPDPGDRVYLEGLVQESAGLTLLTNITRCTDTQTAK